ncbi:hypothetical protein Tco_0833268 [Tanacetum coccineum]
MNLRLCNEESYESLKNSRLQHIHLGIFMIRLHALHRRSAETNALVVLRDTRWEDSQQIIATMEVDLSAGTQLSNTSYMGFQYSVENVMDYLTTTGITSIPGKRKSIEELEGMSWHLKPPEQTSVRVPSRVAVNERLNRSVSLRFERYDAPLDTTPIEEIAATSWGDEFSDDEVTPGKVTILEERSDWDNDERSGGKVLVIKERLAQNQQEFLDEYLPQWDENLAIQKQESGSEWENPFAAKRGENHTILHLSKEEEDDDLPYPKFQNFKQVAAQIIKKH